MGKKEVGIYLINKRKFKELKTNDEIINKLRENLGTKYDELVLKKDKIGNYKIKLYNRISYSADTWSDFWSVKNENNSQKIIDGKKANNFIAFIYNLNNIFCVTTNTAYNDINKDIVYFFGVYMISYFIKDEDKIRSATYNNIMSNFLGGSEYLGEEYQSTIEKYWNRINTNLMAELDRKRLYEELGIQNKRKISKVRCDGKDNFTICSKVDLNQLITIIQKLDEISTDELIDKFNAIEKIKDEELEESLKKILIKKIYDEYLENKLDICIVHKNIESFFSSMQYSFIYETEEKHMCDTIPSNNDVKIIFDELKIDSLDKMEDALKRIQLICYNADGNVQLSDSIDAFINKSIDYKGEEYVVQNKMWYKLTDNYIENLNKVFKFIKNSFSEENIKFKEWKKGNETQYIEQYKNEKDFYQIHPKLEDGIEICDLMYIDRENEEIKMLFLKDGFGANTRDLAIQVTMGVKRLLSILKDDNKIKKFYNKYIKSKSPEYSFNSFKKEIKSFSKNAVMVYKLPKKNKEKSNIGKQSIVFAKSEIETLGTCRFTMKQL